MEAGSRGGAGHESICSRNRAQLQRAKSAERQAFFPGLLGPRGYVLYMCTCLSMSECLYMSCPQVFVSVLVMPMSMSRLGQAL